MTVSACNCLCDNKLFSSGVDKTEFAGYASVFGFSDMQDDVIVKGAFSETLVNHSVKFLWQHHYDEPIGVITNIKEDDFGLYVSGKFVLAVAKAKDAIELLRERAITGLSIGYTPTDYFFDKKNGVRVIKKLQLWEISLVTFPANTLAIAALIDTGEEMGREYRELLPSIFRAKNALNIEKLIKCKPMKTLHKQKECKIFNPQEQNNQSTPIRRQKDLKLIR